MQVVRGLSWVYQSVLQVAIMHNEVLWQVHSPEEIVGFSSPVEKSNARIGNNLIKAGKSRRRSMCF